MLAFSKVLCAILLAGHASAAPAANSSAVSSVASLSLTSEAVGAAPSSTANSASALASGTSSALPASETVAFASDDPNDILWSQNSTTNPQPIRESLGAKILGPQNIPVALQNPDLLAPPTTDSGNIQNAKWPLALSHNRLQTGGWARQQNVDVMPIATSMAGVNMRLEAGAIRELHWHKTAEWAYVLKGSVQVTSINSDGQNYLATANTGDLWYFPPGIPHSLQATNDDPDGAEFLLVFDDGAFSEDSTFLLTDWLAHVPKEVLAKNFKASISAFDHIPGEQLYIFPSAPPPADSKYIVSDPQGQVPNPFVFHLSQVNATKLDGGSVKVVDSTTFTVSTAIAVAEVTVEPGAMRELHWHPTQDEWTYYLEGTGRVTLFGAESNARTFNYQPGDIGYVPASFGHYVENAGNTTLRFLEIFNTDRYQDISLNQWLALTPPEMVKAHLDLDDATIALLSKTKYTVVAGSPSSA
ncbi:oxalate decarboxylase [Dichomitus squalens]|uniref:Oxalate decarboxylase n=1 Tax=Dichomitus squalens TaxID=114155 RepID=A0A4V2K606_9APHY|nr:oxalate decarboxylase [Dichomitus squalens LYAD-421 SS1]EJF64733.1 oxalate decarboxylase [Dichomitus squalens LYAD-421 SS1]TBU33559.1 oxalate decarboxylase [Dichomitus squalens]TBU50433.1 oxalate decarboxylase [Dichomitus squalens]TBU62970.1 oxalate decarboxylase [Dichomitus squalens]